MIVNQNYVGFKDFLRLQGYIGSINYSAFQFLGDLGYTGQLNQRWYRFLRDLGYEGTLQKMMNDWIRDGFPFLGNPTNNPTINSFSYTEPSGGNPPTLSQNITYVGTDTLTTRGVTSTSPVPPDVLSILSGVGVGTLETFSFSTSFPNDTSDITGLSSLSDGATHIHWFVEEDNEDGQSNIVSSIAANFDGTVPTLVSAQSNADGDAISLTFSEIILGSQDTGDWTFTGFSPTVDSVTGFGTNTLNLTLSGDLLENGEVVTVSFTNSDSNLTDIAGNVFANFALEPVTNNVQAPATSNLALLADFDGADDATAYTEESSFLEAFTFNGGSKLDNANVQFGTTSINLTAAAPLADPVFWYDMSDDANMVLSGSNITEVTNLGTDGSGSDLPDLGTPENTGSINSIQAALFSGVSEAFSGTTVAGSTWSTAVPITCAAAFRLDGSGVSRIITSTANGANGGARITLGTNGTDFNVFIRHVDGSNITTTIAAEDNLDHIITFQLSAADLLNVWLDGTQVVTDADVSDASGRTMTNAHMAIGVARFNLSSTNSYWDGDIGEVRWWDSAVDMTAVNSAMNRWIA